MIFGDGSIFFSRTTVLLLLPASSISEICVDDKRDIGVDVRDKDVATVDVLVTDDAEEEEDDKLAVDAKPRATAAGCCASMAAAAAAAADFLSAVFFLLNGHFKDVMVR
jgi:hypothetical protein